MDFKNFIKSATTYVYHVSPNNHIFKLRATGSHKGTQAVKMNQAGIYVSPNFSTAVKWWVSYVAGTKTKKLKKIGGYPKDDAPHFHYSYDEATIYKIEIPKEILEKAWSNTFWEKEYFIPEEDMKYMRIVSSKKYTNKELQKIYTKEGEQSSDHLYAHFHKNGNYASKTKKSLKDIVANKKLKDKKYASSRQADKIDDLLGELNKFIGNPFLGVKDLSKEDIAKIDDIKKDILNLLKGDFSIKSKITKDEKLKTFLI